MILKLLLFPVRFAAWLLLVAAGIMGYSASLVQWAAFTLAQNANWVMAVGDPALREHLRRQRP